MHALASVRAVEDAIGAVPPLNARLLRQLIAAAQYVHDQVVHFYHLQALDWIDPTAALKASPSRAAALAQSISSYPQSTAGLFALVQQRLKTFLASGNIGPFSNGYWGHPGYRLSPELNLVAFSHYLDALNFQRDFIRVHALLGGKNPHPQTYLVGGMASPVDLNSQDAINDNTLEELALLLQSGLDFVQHRRDGRRGSRRPGRLGRPAATRRPGRHGGARPCTRSVWRGRRSRPLPTRPLAARCAPSRSPWAPVSTSPRPPRRGRPRRQARAWKSATSDGSGHPAGFAASPALTSTTASRSSSARHAAAAESSSPARPN